MKALILPGSILLASAALVAVAAPLPAIVQKPGDWTLDVTFEHPQRMIARVGPDDERRLFWYNIITLVNKTDDDAEFYPRCELMTDTFQIIPAGKGRDDI